MSLVTRNRARTLWAYNLRILLGNSYWLIVTPIAITMLTFGWNLATVGLSEPADAARTLELLAPILGALLCAYTVAPEHAGVGELVFVRPISLEKLLVLRLVAIFAFVLFLLLPPLFVYRMLVDGFAAGPTVLAAFVSTLFLSSLALAVAGATRLPLAGVGAASAFWVLDLALGTAMSPLFTLHGYADHLANTPLSDLWSYGKLLLLVLAVLLYLWNRRQLGRPVARRHTLAVVRNVAVVCLLLLGYFCAGAACKVGYGLTHEAELGNRAARWYREAFQVYGPLPVPWLFGRVFPAYLIAEPGRGISLVPAPSRTERELARMEAALARYPHSFWSDHIAYELARSGPVQGPSQPWTVVLCHPGESAAARVDFEAPRQAALIPPPVDSTVKVIPGEDLQRSEALGRFVDAYPHSHFASWALAQRAAIAINVLDFDLATRCYERIVTTYPRSAQAADAGLALYALYLRQGRTQDAWRAAKIAAGAARWEFQGRAYLCAAESAGMLGKSSEAEDCYRRARCAAWTARWRSNAKARTGDTKLLPSVIIREADYVMNTADRALKGQARPPSAPRAATAIVSGRLLRNGGGLVGARVALFQTADAQGLGSPFFAVSSAQTTTAAGGVFRLEGLAPGPYREFAAALPGVYEGVTFTGAAPPFTVTAPETTLPPLTLAKQAPPKPSPPRPRLTPPLAAPPPGVQPAAPGTTRSPRGAGRAASRRGPRTLLVPMPGR